jgi:hypothetical protein
MKMAKMVLSGAALLGSISGAASGAPARSPFDPPQETRREKLAPDPQNPETERLATCFDYPAFTIKQVDLGEVGAASMSVAPSAPGERPPCAEKIQPDEYVIPGGEWTGYFAGVKGDYAFFNAGDGVNGGLGFMALRISSRKKLFDDVADGGLRSVTEKDGGVVLRYRRSFTGSCSVLTGGPACGERLARETGVASIPAPMCVEGYKSAKLAMAKGRCDAQPARDEGCVARELKTLDDQKWDEAPSVFVYEAEAVLGEAAPQIKPLGPALACRPSN